jgi:NADH-quinone oxidoreductase subunit M
MFNHGLTAATLFWLVGILEQRAGGLRNLEDFGGLRAIAPVFCGLMGISIFSSLGLPGLNGFVSEFLIFKGAFPLAPKSTVFALLGLLLTAVFLLNLLQRVFFGPLNPKWQAEPNLSGSDFPITHHESRITHPASRIELAFREMLALAPAIALMFVLGLYPQLLIRAFNSTVIEIARHLKF